eukprot:4235347-Prymnesium_polylepis.1
MAGRPPRHGGCTASTLTCWVVRWRHKRGRPESYANGHGPRQLRLAYVRGRSVRSVALTRVSPQSHGLAGDRSARES